MWDEVGVYRGIERKASEGLTKGCTMLMIACFMGHFNL